MIPSGGDIVVGQEYTDFDKGLEGRHRGLGSGLQPPPSLRLRSPRSPPRIDPTAVRLELRGGADFCKDSAQSRAAQRRPWEAADLRVRPKPPSPSPPLQRGPLARRGNVRTAKTGERPAGPAISEAVVRALRNRQGQPLHRRAPDADLVDQDSCARVRRCRDQERQKRLRPLLRKKRPQPRPGRYVETSLQIRPAPSPQTRRVPRFGVAVGVTPRTSGQVTESLVIPRQKALPLFGGVACTESRGQVAAIAEKLALVKARRYKTLRCRGKSARQLDLNAIRHPTRDLSPLTAQAFADRHGKTGRG